MGTVRYVKNGSPHLKLIGLRMDALAREYGHTLSGDPRRAEIINELFELCRRRYESQE